jgi:hypothetical protein
MNDSIGNRLSNNPHGISLYDFKPQSAHLHAAGKLTDDNLSSILNLPITGPPTVIGGFAKFVLGSVRIRGPR